MSVPLFVFTASLPFATILIVFAMRSWSAVQQAKARLANDDAYRQIADRASTAQADTAASLASIQDSLAEVRTRLAAVEKVLKDVE